MTLAGLMTVLLAILLPACAFCAALIVVAVVAGVCKRRRRRRKSVSIISRNGVEMDREETRAGLVDYYFTKIKGLPCSSTYKHV